MEENAKYINLAHHYLDSLYVKKDFEEVLFMLDDACVWLGPCDDEHFSKKEIICEYLKESLKHVERSFLGDEKIHIATQCKEQIVFAITYSMHYKTHHKDKLMKLDQHCTMVIDKNSKKILYISISDTVQSVLERAVESETEMEGKDDASMIRVVEEMNEIIQMIDANQRCGLKGSNDDDMFSYYYVNEGLYRMLGYTYNEFMEMSGGTAVGTVYPPDLAKALDDVAECFSKGEEYSTEYRIRKKDGSLMWVIDSGRKHINKCGEKQINSILMDITQLKQSQISLQVERERYRIALENITDVMFEYDVEKDCLIKYIKKDNNRENPVEEVHIENYFDYLERDYYVHLDDIGHLKAVLLGSLDKNEINLRLFHDGEWRWVEIQCAYIYEDQKAVKCIGIWKDITDEKMTMEHLIDLSLRDPLTNLYHQKAVEANIQELMKEEAKCAMMIMDIDKFKNINDSFGHLKGNDLLLAVKNILKKVCRDCEYVCRIGGDEFLVFLNQETSDKAIAYANEILENVKKLQIEQTHIGISIGITYANKGDLFQSVFTKADEAMYLAKKNGRNRIEVVN